MRATIKFEVLVSYTTRNVLGDAAEIKKLESIIAKGKANKIIIYTPHLICKQRLASFVIASGGD